METNPHEQLGPHTAGALRVSATKHGKILWEVPRLAWENFYPRLCKWKSLKSRHAVTTPSNYFLNALEKVQWETPTEKKVLFTQKEA